MEKPINIDGMNDTIDSYRGNKRPHRSFKEWWHERHHKKLYVLVILLAVFLLAWLIWHKQMSDMWASLFGKEPASSTSKIATLDGAANLPTTANSGGGRNSNTTASETSRSSSTTTTTTTTITNPPDGSDGSTDGSNSLLSLSSNVKPGLTRQQVIDLANGAGPNSCTEITLLNLAQQSVCTWTADGKSVVVTMQNGLVVGQPIKVGF